MSFRYGTSPSSYDHLSSLFSLSMRLLLWRSAVPTISWVSIYISSSPWRWSIYAIFGLPSLFSTSKIIPRESSSSFKDRVSACNRMGVHIFFEFLKFLLRSLKDVPQKSHVFSETIVSFSISYIWHGPFSSPKITPGQKLLANIHDYCFHGTSWSAKLPVFRSWITFCVFHTSCSKVVPHF